MAEVSNSVPAQAKAGTRPMARRAKRSYTAEFKAEAVKQVLEGGEEQRLDKKAVRLGNMSKQAYNAKWGRRAAM